MVYSLHSVRLYFNSNHYQEYSHVIYDYNNTKEYLHEDFVFSLYCNKYD